MNLVTRHDIPLCPISRTAVSFSKSAWAGYDRLMELVPYNRIGVGLLEEPEGVPEEKA